MTNWKNLLKLSTSFEKRGFDTVLVRRGEGPIGDKVVKSGFITRDPRVPSKHRAVGFKKGYGYYYIK